MMRKIIVAIIVTSIILTGLIGCNKNPSGSKQQNTSIAISTSNSTVYNSTTTTTNKQDAFIKAVLYFSDKNAMYLVKEQRDIKLLQGGTVSSPAEKAKIFIEELMKGSANKDLSTSIPKTTKLRSVTQEKDMLIVDLSKEFVQDNVGGSAGETMALAPIVITLTDIEGIKQVSFRIEGKQQKDFKGHIEIDKPFKRSDFEELISK